VESLRFAPLYVTYPAGVTFGGAEHNVFNRRNVRQNESTLLNYNNESKRSNGDYDPPKGDYKYPIEMTYSQYINLLNYQERGFYYGLPTPDADPYEKPNPRPYDEAIIPGVSKN